MDEGLSQQQPFPTTQWSLIVRVAADDPAEREEALGQICRSYWPPVYAFIRSRGHSPHDAEDLTQGLFAGLLSRNDFARVDAAHGRLRNYLLTAVKNHLNGQYRRERRLKRGGGLEMLSFDATDAEERCVIPEPVDEVTPEKVFERQWAVTVMEQVADALRERYEKKGQATIFQALKPYIMTDVPLPTQPELASELGVSSQALRTALHRLRERYAEALRDIVRATLGRDESVEDEISRMMAAFQ